MALGPGPAGLKFWTPQGLTADNAADINNLPAGATNWFNPWGPKRPVQDFVRGTPPQYLSAPFTLAADAGSYSLTGSAVDLALRHVAGAGNYTLTGAAAGLTVPGDTTNLPAGAANWFNPWGPRQPQRSWTQGGIQLTPVVLVAASGSYTLTGTAAASAFGHVAGSGSYSVSGNSVALALGHVAAAGSYNLTGSSAALALRHVAGAGSYTLTGSSAALAFRHVAAAGSYTLTGAAAGLTVAVNYAAAAGSYTLTGSAATFAFGHVAGSGSYALTGSAAGLVIPGAVTYLPAGMTGSYVPWGRRYPTALLTRTGRPLSETAAPITLTAAGGSYTLTGAAAGLTVASPPDTTHLPAGAANWFNPWRRPYPVALLTRTGRPLAVGPFTLAADAGSYTITGSSAALALRLTANSGAYAVSGSAAVLARGFAAGAGAYAILGTDAQLVQAGTITLTAGPGSYVLTGSAALLTVSVTPPEVTPPPAGGTGFRVGRYKQFKLKKKRKHDQCEELLEYLRNLPPAEAEAAVAELPPSYLSLLDGLPLPHALVLPPHPSRSPQDDDDDDDACALLLEMLLR